MTGNLLTLGDVLGCLWAVVVFGLVLLVPGHCLGWMTNLLGFRQRGAVQQATWSVAFSFAVAPIAAVMLGKYGSIAAVCWLFATCGILTLGMNYWAHRQDKDKRFQWSRVIGMSIGLLWILFVVLELVDFGIGSHLYLSVTVFDHSLRTAFVDSVMRTGVPPANPLYWPGHDAPMRYYYFWYVVTGVAAKLAGVTARRAMIASVAWAGFGLAAIVALYCRNFLVERASSGNEKSRRWPRVAVALALLSVTGLDIIPAIVKALVRMPADPDMEWWSSDQFASWIDSLLWVPHHIAGLICCLLGFLLVWMSKGRSALQKCLCALIAGLAFASAFGLSTWVPVAFAMVMLAWILWAMAWERESRPRVPVLLGAGLVAVLALTPYLAELRAAPVASSAIAAGTSISTGASHVLGFRIRRIIDPSALWDVPSLASLGQTHPVLKIVIALVAGLLVLPLAGYFVELGFFGMVLVVTLKAMRRSQLEEADRTALFLSCVVLLIANVVGSTVIASNDFGWRSVLIAQFFLLLLAVRWCEGAFGTTTGPLSAAMLAMLGIGLAGSIYQVIGLRLYLPVEEKLGRAGEVGLSERAMALRRGFDAMDGSIPRSAIIQFNAAQPSEYLQYAQVMDARRQMATAYPKCVSAFGGDPASCPGVEASAARLFAAGASLSADGARTECAHLGVNDLVANRWDSVWADRQGWVWTLPAAVDTGDVRVLNCRSSELDPLR